MSGTPLQAVVVLFVMFSFILTCGKSMAWYNCIIFAIVAIIELFTLLHVCEVFEIIKRNTFHRCNKNVKCTKIKGRSVCIAESKKNRKNVPLYIWFPYLGWCEKDSCQCIAKKIIVVTSNIVVLLMIMFFTMYIVETIIPLKMTFHIFITILCFLLVTIWKKIVLWRPRECHSRA